MSTTNILDLNNRIDALEKNSGGGGSADSAKRSDIATEFSATTAYTAGCFVYYEGKLYQFNADHAAGAWDPTDVVEANVTDQVVSNASAIAGLTASDVAYDNTTSGLSATNEQAAIDELAGDISGLTASDVDYVNTTSGLTATDVQGAVDELADSYPAAKVMMSDGVTSVESVLNSVRYYSLDVPSTPINTAWGSMYRGTVTISNLPESLLNKKIIYSYIATDNNAISASATISSDGYSITLTLIRPDSTYSTSGKLYLIVAD